jgi:allantoin racemase
VYACDIPVLQIDADPTSIEPIGDLCASALERDASRAIVLGCAAMAPFAAPLSRRLGVPVIDGVVAATLLAEALVALSPR